jgi:hypothetical protein
MSDLTTEKVVVEARNEALDKAQQMNNAGVSSRAQEYAALKFEVASANCFTAVNPESDRIDLVDMVLDAVEARMPLEFMPHRDGNGQQTVYWHQV